MAKASIPGRTKTRLVPPLTFAEAASFNTAFLQDVAANLQAAAHHAPLQAFMAYGPPGCQQFFLDHLPREIGLIEAWESNFGDCLYLAIETLLGAGHGAAVVLNSDSPTLPTAFLVEAAELLARPGDCAVLGPSTDGGYYLLGLKTAHRRMFEDIDWSTERVAQQTLQRARQIGLRVHRLPSWYDVDDVQSLRRLDGDLSEARKPDGSSVPFRAPHTAALMRDLSVANDLGTRIGLPSAAVERLAS